MATQRAGNIAAVNKPEVDVRHVEIPLPEHVDCTAVEAAIEQALRVQNLNVTLRGTLKTYPGSVHWHARSGRRPGTLEITLWPHEHRAWFSIQSGRQAEWIDAQLSAMSAAILAAV